MNPARAFLAALALVLGGCHGRHLADMVKTEGPVDLERWHWPTRAAVIEPLYAEDRVSTRAGASAWLRLADGKELEAGENTRFRLLDKEGTVVVEVETGLVMTTAPEAGPGPTVDLQIVTPTASNIVSSGSKATFKVTSQTSTVDVKTGEIAVVISDGTRRGVKAGETVEVGFGTIQVKIESKAPPAKTQAPAQVAIQLEPMEFRLGADRGTLLVRAKGGKSYTRAAKKAAAVAAGTSYRLDPKGQASLTSEGLHMVLRGGARGEIGEAAGNGEERRYVVRLDDGEADIVLDGEGRRKISLPGLQGDFELNTSRETSATLRRTRKGSTLEVLAGEAAVESKSGKTTVKAGEVAEVTAAGVRTAAATKAALVLPAGKTTRIHADHVHEVALALPETGNDGAPVRVEVASDSGFKDILVAGDAAGSSVKVRAPASGDLFWRAKGQAASATGHARFMPDTRRSLSDLANPHFDVSETGQIATAYFQSKLPSLTFKFPAHEGAKKYRLRVYRVEDPARPIVDKTVDDLECLVESGSLGEGQYAWLAAPLDGAGNELAGGRMNKLDIVYDNSTATLDIAKPRSGDAAGASVVTQGVAPLGSRLFINSKAAPLDGKGRFEVTLSPAPSTIVYRLVGKDGAENYWLRTLRAGK